MKYFLLFEAELLRWGFIAVLLVVCIVFGRNFFITNLVAPAVLALPLFCLLGFIATSGIGSCLFGGVPGSIISACIVSAFAYALHLDSSMMVNLSTGLPPSDVPVTVTAYAIGVGSKFSLIFFYVAYFVYLCSSIVVLIIEFGDFLRRLMITLLILSLGCWPANEFYKIYDAGPLMVKSLVMQFDAVKRHGCSVRAGGVDKFGFPYSVPVIFSSNGRVYSVAAGAREASVSIREVSCKWVDPLFVSPTFIERRY